MHRLSVPTLSNVPSLSDSSGADSIPPSGLCTPNDDDPSQTITEGFFSKPLSASMEDLFATPRPKYGLSESVNDEDTSITGDVPLIRRASGYADDNVARLGGPERSHPSPPARALERPRLLFSSGDLLGSLNAQAFNTPSPPSDAELWTTGQLLCLGTKVLFFLPWCVAVGGVILLSPRHLELVAFKTGYGWHERGPQRFGYWAQCAHQHVVIFLAFLSVGVWWDLRYGTWVVAAVLACCVYAWHDFKVDLTVPIGEDDRQSLYLALSKVYLQDNFVMRVPTARASHVS